MKNRAAWTRRCTCGHGGFALTQPAVSLQIRQLEELLGQPLFDYVAKKLYLTPAAEALLRASEDVFGRLEALDMQLSDLQGSLQGQLSLAVESSAKYLVPHLFAAFRAQHPEVSLQLVVVNHAQAVRRLSVSRDDLLIMSQPPSELPLDFFPFFTNPIVSEEAAEMLPPEAPRYPVVDHTVVAQIGIRRIGAVGRNILNAQQITGLRGVGAVAFVVGNKFARIGNLVVEHRAHQIGRAHV
mgnify:CR=1 FL=1